jgi:hypothetical protein
MLRQPVFRGWSSPEDALKIVMRGADKEDTIVVMNNPELRF